MPIKEIRTMPYSALYNMLHREEILITSDSCDFQRGGEDGVWSKKKKQEFIKSLNKKFPIGSITLVRYKDKWLVLDGGNRCRALRDFRNNKFEVNFDGESVKYEDITFKDRLLEIQIVCEQIELQEHEPDTLISDMFIALNLGSTKLCDGELLKAIGWNDTKQVINVAKLFIQDKWNTPYKNKKVNPLRKNWQEVFGEIKESNRYKMLENFVKLILSSLKDDFDCFDKSYNYYNSFLNEEYDLTNVFKHINTLTDIMRSLPDNIEIFGKKKGFPPKNKIAVIWYLVIKDKTEHISYFEYICTHEAERNVYLKLLNSDGDNHTGTLKIEKVVTHIETFMESLRETL